MLTNLMKRVAINYIILFLGYVCVIILFRRGLREKSFVFKCATCNIYIACRSMHEQTTDIQ